MNRQKGPLAAAALLALIATGVASGCATKNFVRTEVTTKADELTARIDQNEQSIKQVGTQTEELSNVTREHNQRIATLDTNVKQVDDKANRATTVGQSAQTAADRAGTQVTALDQRFRARNNLQVLSEDMVPFAFDSSKLPEESSGVLTEMARRLTENPDAILVLEGHTDNVGADTYNEQLGEKRLDAVVRSLVVDHNVPLHRIYKMSFGEAKPLADNTSREGRAKNRSVSVRLMGPNEGASAVSENR
jgi:outer membrane protein OmpA-like peptidoglycan-associated protein